MEAAIEETPAQRLETAFDLFDLAIELMETRIKRERPEATQAEIDAAIDAWLTRRPGAELGDAEGTPR